ncbi:hypothetical protein HAX54_000373 [Datura stramonium]|uniref:Uncharacterized protein n=1 Tax=Datura stramonium TaxID=4076 RepID=A0ABS8RSI2_DATST|nr:hypothetical protein [Datura stramonium]
MAKSDNEDNEEVTFLAIKKNLKDYSLKELRSLVNVLIYAFCDLAKEKEFLNKNLDEYETEKTVMKTQFTKLEEKYSLLSFENRTLIKKLEVVSPCGEKGKGVGSNLQVELEEKLEKISIEPQSHFREKWGTGEGPRQDQS